MGWHLKGKAGLHKFQDPFKLHFKDYIQKWNKPNSLISDDYIN
jgi:hypothetical protein